MKVRLIHKLIITFTEEEMEKVDKICAFRGVTPECLIKSYLIEGIEKDLAEMNAEAS